MHDPIYPEAGETVAYSLKVNASDPIQKVNLNEAVLFPPT